MVLKWTKATNLDWLNTHTKVNSDDTFTQMSEVADKEEHHLRQLEEFFDPNYPYDKHNLSVGAVIRFTYPDDIYYYKVVEEEDIRQLVKEGSTIGWKKNASLEDYIFTYEEPDTFGWKQGPEERITLTKDGELVGWRNTIPALPSRYVQTVITDFDSNGNYTGGAEYIILPSDKPSGYKIVNPNVKGVATNGDYLTNATSMFYDNPSLYLELDYLDTSQVIHMSQMFRGSQATSLDLSNFNTSNVINMRLMFHSAQATELDLSSFDTSNVADMTYMFVRTQASILDLSSFDTSNLTDMATMFLEAQTTTGYARTQADANILNNTTNKPSTLTFVAKLPPRYVQTTVADFNTGGDYIGTEEYIILPNDKPSGYNITNSNVKGVATNGNYLTDTSRMFRNNSSLYLELDYLDTSNVTKMTTMFDSSQATTLNLSGFDTSKVTAMNQMFYYSKATSINLSSFDTSNVTTMFVMFRNSRATTLDLSSFDTSNTTVNQMFRDSKATTGYARTQADADKFNSSPDKPSTLTFVVKLPPRYVQTTTSDFTSGGDYTGTEEYIILPADKPSGYRIRNANVKGVATNGDYLTSAHNMFWGHNGLYLELDYLDTSNVTGMSSMLRNTQATELDLSNFDTSKVTAMNQMFQGSQATELDLSSFDTSNVTNMLQMFYNSKATSINLSSFDTSNVTTMFVMFRNSRATTLDLSSFDTSNTTVNQMFRDSKATTGYARTQADADKFNSTSNKPSTLTFVVK